VVVDQAGSRASRWNKGGARAHERLVNLRERVEHSDVREEVPQAGAVVEADEVVKTIVERRSGLEPQIT
jgi:hypothetical protein